MSEQVMEMMSLLRQINMRLHHCLKELYEPLGLTGPQAVVMIELFKEDGQRICDLAETAGMTVSNIQRSSAAGAQRLSASRAFSTGSAHGADLSVGEIAAADPRLRSSDRASK